MHVADLNVLIVDDHPAMRELLRKVLTRAGFASVREAASGAEALAGLEEAPAQLILADQNMPAMSGADFIARVRADPRWRGARILLITGDARAKADRADAVLVKPVLPRDLIAAIERVLAS